MISESSLMRSFFWWNCFLAAISLGLSVNFRKSLIVQDLADRQVLYILRNYSYHFKKNLALPIDKDLDDAPLDSVKILNLQTFFSRYFKLYKA